MDSDLDQLILIGAACAYCTGSPLAIPVALAYLVCRNHPPLWAGLARAAIGLGDDPAAWEIPQEGWKGMAARLIAPAAATALAPEKLRVIPALPQAQDELVELPRPVIAPVQQDLRLLDALDASHHCAITGQTDAGKTTLLRAVIARAVERKSEVVVLDPHDAPGKWAGCKTIGGGRNYGAIGVALSDILETMNTRYQDLASGKVREGDHPPLVLVSDEWISIMNQVKEAKSILLAVITEGRKVRIKMTMAGHSRFLSGLGLDDSDQKASLAICVLYKSHGQRIAKLNGREYQVPMLTGTEPVPEPVLEAEPVPELPDDELIVKLNGLGLSRNRIAAALGGNKEARMNQIRKVLGGMS